MAEKTKLEIAQEQYDTALADANAALAEKSPNYEAYDEAILRLEEAEKAYAENVAKQMYEEYAATDAPIINIIKAYKYTIIGHKEKRNKDNGNRIVSVDPITRKKSVDLLAFCKLAKLDTSWTDVASKFNQLMCLRAAKSLGCDVRSIAKSYFLKEAVKKIAMGETPTSNTQVCKLLQRVIDNMLPNEDENGKAIYKCNNHDVAYLDHLYGKKSNKNDLAVRVSNDSFLRRILLDIAYRLVTGSHYDLDGFKVVKD